MRLFWTQVSMGIRIRMPWLKNWQKGIYNKKKEYATRVTFLLEIKPQKYTFSAKCDYFVATYALILNTSKDANVHTYATTQEQKKKRSTVKRKNIKEGFCNQVTFHLEIYLQKVQLHQL